MNPSLPLPAIVAILAGGKATRFDGQDKGEILINGLRLIDIIHERLKPQFTDIIISGSQDYGLGISVIPDAPAAPGGPVGGVYSIWKHLESRNVEGFFTVAIDGPNLPQDLTGRLYNANSSAVATDQSGRHPTYSWWRMDDLGRVFSDIDTSQSISLNRLADITGANDVRWSGDESFININRPDDLRSFVKGA